MPRSGLNSFLWSLQYNTWYHHQWLAWVSWLPIGLLVCYRFLRSTAGISKVFLYNRDSEALRFLQQLKQAFSMLCVYISSVQTKLFRKQALFVHLSLHEHRDIIKFRWTHRWFSWRGDEITSFLYDFRVQVYWILGYFFWFLQYYEYNDLTEVNHICINFDFINLCF